MDFNNQQLIAQAKSTHAKEVEVLYWIVEDSLSENNSGKAKAILTILLYTAKYKPEVIQTGLKPIQRRRLKEITHEILDNCSIQKKEPIEIKPASLSQSIPFKYEHELQTYLIDHKDILKRALEEDNIRIVGKEVETGVEDYRCDIVAESSKFFYPIELKIAQGTHAAVSQCSKYCYYFYRKLRYDRFKQIQGVVIARGFDTWSINALRREGHWIFNILPDGDTDIVLERIR